MPDTSGAYVSTSQPPPGLPTLWAPAPAKEDERDIAHQMPARSGLARPGQTIIAGKGYRRAGFENTLNQA